MGMVVSLQTERGEDIKSAGDPRNLLGGLLPSLDDSTYQLLRFIDPYGDTVFNRLQIDTFIAEWRQLYRYAKTDDEHQVIKQVEELAEACREQPHRYLKFIGD